MIRNDCLQVDERYSDLRPIGRGAYGLVASAVNKLTKRKVSHPCSALSRFISIAAAALWPGGGAAPRRPGPAAGQFAAGGAAARRLPLGHALLTGWPALVSMHAVACGTTTLKEYSHCQ